MRHDWRQTLDRCTQRLMQPTSAMPTALNAVLAELSAALACRRIGLYYRSTAEAQQAVLLAEAGTAGLPALAMYPAIHALAFADLAPTAVQQLAAGADAGGPVAALFTSCTLVDALRAAELDQLQLLPLGAADQWAGWLLCDRGARATGWDDQITLLAAAGAALISVALARSPVTAVSAVPTPALRSLEDNLPDAHIYQLHEVPGGPKRLTYLSRGLEALTGISVEQAISDPQYRFVCIHEADDASVWQADRHASATRTRFDQEFRYYAADGTIRWMHARAVPRVCAEGSVFWDGVAIDFTERRRAEEAVTRQARMQHALARCSQRLLERSSADHDQRAVLAAALEHLRAAAQVGRVALFENFEHPELGFASRMLAEACDPAAGSLLAQEPDHCIPWSLVPAAHMHALAGGEHVGGPCSAVFATAPQLLAVQQQLGIKSVQFFAIHVDGVWWGYLGFDDYATARTWDDQEIVLIRTAAEIFAAYFQRQAVERALRASRELLEAVIEHAPLDIFVRDRHGKFILVNQLYASHFNEQSGNMVGRDLADFVPADITARWLEQDNYIRNTGQPMTFTSSLRIQGVLHHYLMNKFPLADSSGAVVGVVGLATDIGELRALEESLRQANDDLQQRVANLSLLHQVAQTVTTITSLSMTLDVVGRTMLQAYTAGRVTIALCNGIDASFSPGADVLADHAVDVPLDLAADLATSYACTSRQASLVFDEGVGVIAAPLQIGETTLGVLRIERAMRAELFTPNDMSLAQTLAGLLAGAVQSAQLYNQALVARERLERLYQAGRMIAAAGLNREELYRAIHSAVARLMPAEAFVIIMVDERTATAEDVYLADQGGLWPGSQYPLAGSFAAFLLKEKGTVRFDDFRDVHGDEFHFQMFGAEEDTLSGIAAPFGRIGGMQGFVFTQSYRARAYTQEDQVTLELLVAHAATAIENAHRAEQALVAATDAERNRLARDLHDSVTQSLFSASLIAERLPVAFEHNPTEARGGLTMLHQLVQGALAEMRAMLNELRPKALVNTTLDQALGQLIQAFVNRQAVPVAVDLAPLPLLPPAVQIALYRIVQESLNNIAKHARARQVTITLTLDPPFAGAQGADWSGELTIWITDDGRGFDPAHVQHERMGLNIMRERARVIEARLAVDSTPAGGTQITVCWRGTVTAEGGKYQ